MGQRRTRSARAASFDRSTTCFSKGISSSYSPMSAFQQKEASGWKYSVNDMISFSSSSALSRGGSARIGDTSIGAVGAPGQTELAADLRNEVGLSPAFS